MFVLGWQGDVSLCDKSHCDDSHYCVTLSSPTSLPGPDSIRLEAVPPYLTGPIFVQEMCSVSVAGNGVVQRVLSPDQSLLRVAQSTPYIAFPTSNT